MYKVIHMFRDLADNCHIYQPGDNFPRAGLDVSAQRLQELASGDNLRGKPLIQPVQADDDKGMEIPAEEQKPAAKPRRSRKKG